MVRVHALEEVPDGLLFPVTNAKWTYEEYVPGEWIPESLSKRVPEQVYADSVEAVQACRRRDWKKKLESLTKKYESSSPFSSGHQPFLESDNSKGIVSSKRLVEIVEAANLNWNVIKQIRSRCVPLRKLTSETGGLVEGNRFGDTRAAESMKQISSSLARQGLKFRPTKPKFFGRIMSDRSELHDDLGAQPSLAETYGWTSQNSLKKVRSKVSGDPNIQSNSRRLFTSAVKLAGGMLVLSSTPMVQAVQAIAPEAAEPGSLQGGHFEKWSNFWFGVVSCIGVLAAIITLLKSWNWKKRHSIAAASTASAPAGAIMNRPVNVAQTLTGTVLRAWRETEYYEVLVAP